MVRPAPRFRRRARKMARRKPRRHVSGLGRKSISNYAVNLLPVWLQSTTGTPTGTVNIVSDQTNLAPIHPSGGGVSSVISVPDAAGSGLVDYWSWGMALPFALSDLQQQTLPSIFDYFRINSVTCKVTYLANFASVTGTGVLPTIYTYIDNDDAVVPDAAYKVIGRQGVQKHDFTATKTSFTITFKPKFKAVTGLVGGTVQISKPTTGWLDCAQSHVQHYGLKFWFENFPLIGSGAVPADPPVFAPPMGIQFDFKYNLSFKAPINMY